MIRALVTGFGPFPRVPRNPSDLLVSRMREPVPGMEVERIILPTDYRQADRLIESRLDRRLNICLCIGVGRGDMLRLETTARNFGTIDTPDQSGFIPIPGAAIAPNGPETYTATMPLERIQAALREQGYPVALSDDAGGYVCNFVFYRVLHEIARWRLPAVCVFLHIPELDPARGETAQLDSWCAAVRTILTVAATDLPIPPTQ